MFNAILRVFGSGIHLGMVTSSLPQHTGCTPLMLTFGVTLQPKLLVLVSRVEKVM